MTFAAYRARLVALAAAALPLAAQAASWTECNDVPVRLESYPTPMKIDRCSVAPGSGRERAFYGALYDARNYSLAVSFGGDFTRIVNGRCVIEHGDGISQLAVVQRSDIDGLAGLTVAQDDGCTFSWEEMHIEEADVMLASDMLFTVPDESRSLGSTRGTAMGFVVAEHELGHAQGLEHSTAFAVMRDGTAARVPFVGSSIGSGGSRSYYVGDDAFGLRSVYGIPTAYRNLFATSQLLRNGRLIDNAVDPGNGDAPYVGTQSRCPGQTLSFYASIGNVGTFSETSSLRIFADPSATVCGTAGGTPLQTRTGVTVGRHGAFAFPVTVTIPAALPRNVPLSVYVEIDADQKIEERREYDNCARTALVLVVRSVADCGG